MSPLLPEDAHDEAFPDSSIAAVLTGVSPFDEPSLVASKLLQLLRSNLAAILWHDRFHSQSMGVIACDARETGIRDLFIFKFPEPLESVRNSQARCIREFPAERVANVQSLNWITSRKEAKSSQILLGVPDSSESRNQLTVAETLAFRFMEWSLQFQEKLQEQKLSALVEYAAGAGHEINNPLGSIIGRASQLLKGETDPERRHLLESIGAQAYRIGDMIGDTMLFANPPTMKFAPVNYQNTLEEVAEKFRSRFDQRGIALAISSGAVNVSGEADATQIKTVLAELLRNSLQAFDQHEVHSPRLEISVGEESHSERSGIAFTFVDNGKGMSVIEQEHCFDPFFSGRQAGRGLGFGLSKCWRIVRLHNGTITLRSENGKTLCKIWLPLEKIP
ncbi:sensor histidine kinase [Planctomicrobium sp. SH668]|uniref:sensor histidine kinase n=1 Tax=Planctomicrobium sp. SH668 TaxID=3448126 RepID=UPI003F5B5797